MFDQCHSRSLSHSQQKPAASRHPFCYCLGAVQYVVKLGKPPSPFEELSHTTLYYHYGTMVDESSEWDIHGYDL